jgi:hypothetical protein
MNWEKFVSRHEGSPHVVRINGLKRLIVEEMV